MDYTAPCFSCILVSANALFSSKSMQRPAFWTPDWHSNWVLMDPQMFHMYSQSPCVPTWVAKIWVIIWGGSWGPVLRTVALDGLILNNTVPLNMPVWFMIKHSHYEMTSIHFEDWNREKENLSRLFVQYYTGIKCGGRQTRTRRVSLCYWEVSANWCYEPRRRQHRHVYARERKVLLFRCLWQEALEGSQKSHLGSRSSTRRRFSSRFWWGLQIKGTKSNLMYNK